MSILAYLSTPYIPYRGGTLQAREDAARIVARLMPTGIMAYSPVVHCDERVRHQYPDLILQHDELMMERCDVLIVGRLSGWEYNDQVRHALDFFLKMNKPIFDLDTKTMRMRRQIGLPEVV